eukprot:3374086-Prymnesium_polylepis.1
MDAFASRSSASSSDFVGAKVEACHRRIYLVTSGNKKKKQKKIRAKVPGVGSSVHQSVLLESTVTIRYGKRTVRGTTVGNTPALTTKVHAALRPRGCVHCKAPRI